ncbi:MAG: CD225/dispanin family protein [Proteiniphilum sp.]|jgi:hypothetical protein|nr:CD225/dispanin family protein [Proteiniphilum sp.]
MEYQNNSSGQPAFPQDQASFDGLPPLKPNSWLWLSIAVAVLCCTPFGIVSIIYAAKVDSLYFRGRYEESKRMSQKAKMWILISVCAALLYCILCIILLATGNLQEYLERIRDNASGYNF